MYLLQFCFPLVLIGIDMRLNIILEKLLFLNIFRGLFFSSLLLFSTINHAENNIENENNTLAILIIELSQKIGDEPSRVLLALNDDCHYFASASSRELGKIKLTPIKGICKKADRSGFIEESFNNESKLSITVDARINENFYTGEQENKLTAMKKIDIRSWINNH